MKKPTISIVIPTYSVSQDIIEIPLESINKQRLSKKDYEIILADNTSKASSKIKKIAKKYGAIVISITGRPSQACVQVNEGVKRARADYILLMDHDISINEFFLQDLFSLIKKHKKTVDAYYVPYKIVSRNKWLTKIRNFEEQFYTKSIIAAPRIIKRETFLNTESKYDISLNAGPADWDMAIQLKLMNVKFGEMNNFFYHHEEQMTIWQFLNKKKIYAKGNEIYKNKWKSKNPEVYNNIVKRQYDPFYRLITIFFKNENWKKLLPSMHYYLAFVFLKFLMAFSILLFKEK